MTRRWLITHRAGTPYMEDHCVCESLDEAIDEVRQVFGPSAAETLGRLAGAMLATHVYPATAEVKIHISSKAQGGAGLVAADGSGALTDTILLRSLDADREWFGCLTRE